MFGLIIQLAVSWILIRIFEKKNLRVLGFMPTKKRLFDFGIFFFITAIICSSGFFMRMYFAGQLWMLNPDISANLILAGIWWNIKSVLFEELIFRGAVFYILLKKLGAQKAILISSVAFGIYHWFSQEVFGNPAQMAITFLITGAAGLLYAYGFAKTFSLYVPVAIHLGWNLTQSVIFSETVIGDQLFIPVKPVPDMAVSYVVYFCILFIPTGGMLLANYFILKKKKQSCPPSG